ncbi:MAG: hypothetical protein K0R27_3947 [Xanthobacteraceae bacterium]|jgi:hypothetical protein|nr:hypothetical protein [Xanthobacteraceae bacterium]
MSAKGVVGFRTITWAAPSTSVRFISFVPTKGDGVAGIFGDTKRAR